MPVLLKDGKKVGDISYNQSQGEIDSKVQEARKKGLSVQTNPKGLKGRNASGSLYGANRKSSKSRRSKAY
tara:strand:+ start:325 stop:534 length:210 start_codon:yes stop_codon:yes gene_type:complete